MSYKSDIYQFRYRMTLDQQENWNTYIYCLWIPFSIYLLDFLYVTRLIPVPPPLANSKLLTQNIEKTMAVLRRPD